jgi:hypothetical protein
MLLVLSILEDRQDLGQPACEKRQERTDERHHGALPYGRSSGCTGAVRISVARACVNKFLTTNELIPATVR